MLVAPKSFLLSALIAHSFRGMLLIVLHGESVGFFACGEEKEAVMICNPGSSRKVVYSWGAKVTPKMSIAAQSV